MSCTALNNNKVRGWESRVGVRQIKSADLQVTGGICIWSNLEKVKQYYELHSYGTDPQVEAGNVDVYGYENSLTSRSW